MANPEEALYSEGEKILCYHGPLLYEAKCLKHRLSEEKIPEYLVHYQGWSKNWDEWVKETRILKYTNANLATQKELREQELSKSARKKGKRKSLQLKDGKSSHDVKSEGSTHDPDSRSSTPSVDGRPRGRPPKSQSKETTPTAPLPAVSPCDTISVEEIKVEDYEIKENEVDDPLPEAEPTFKEVIVPAKKMKKEPVVLIRDILYSKEIILSNPENATVHIPANLLDWVVEDWYQVNKLKRLVNLPAAITVIDILEDYKQFKQSQQPTMPEYEILRVAIELEAYFDGCLGAFLLFKCERPQYADIKEAHPGKAIPAIYGAHHFMRLFIKSKQLLECLPESAVKPVVTTFEDVIAFLFVNKKKYFSTTNYGIAPPEYHRRNI